jgi:hypothetical protein
MFKPATDFFFHLSGERGANGAVVAARLTSLAALGW